MTRPPGESFRGTAPITHSATSRRAASPGTVVQVPAILQTEALATSTIGAYLESNQHTALGVYVDVTTTRGR